MGGVYVNMDTLFSCIQYHLVGLVRLIYIICQSYGEELEGIVLSRQILC
jgi:hypothetical protein